MICQFHGQRLPSVVRVVQSGVASVNGPQSQYVFGVGNGLDKSWNQVAWRCILAYFTPPLFAQSVQSYNLVPPGQKTPLYRLKGVRPSSLAVLPIPWTDLYHSEGTRGFRKRDRFPPQLGLLLTILSGSVAWIDSILKVYLCDTLNAFVRRRTVVTTVASTSADWCAASFSGVRPSTESSCFPPEPLHFLTLRPSRQISIDRRKSTGLALEGTAPTFGLVRRTRLRTELEQ